MKILLTGAAGMLGRDLAPLLETAGHQVRGVDIKDFDICEKTQVDAYLRGKEFDLCIHTAAFTNVDACEDDSDKAFRMNADGAENVAVGCAKMGASIVFVSTDYVFSGSASRPYREDDEPGPLSVYGRSKLAGEERVKQSNPDWCIVRTCGLYGRCGNNFVDVVLKKAAAGEALRVVGDQMVSPTWTTELSRSLVAVVDKKARGIFHLVSDGKCSWYEFAAEILRLSGNGDVPLTEITSDQLDRRAKRPPFSALDNSKAKEQLGCRMSDWREALTGYLKGAGKSDG